MKTVFFDLDGTLLPMDQDAFVKGYFSLLAAKMKPYGYDPQTLFKSIWKGVEAMVRGDGSSRGEETFWDCFSSIYGEGVRKHIPLFEEFYANEFQQAKIYTAADPKATELIAWLRGRGIKPVLATNPVFPQIATYSRIRWAGLSPDDFQLVTTYENTHSGKPNPLYYLEILKTLGLEAKDCIMVGNDAYEDMTAEKLGFSVFLLTNCLINTKGADIDQWPHGGFDELKAFLERELAEQP